MVTNAEVLEKRREVLARFIEAYRETIDWMYSDSAALKTYAELAGVSEIRARRLRDEFFTKNMLLPDKILGLNAILKDAVASKYIPAPLSKKQIAELIQIPSPSGVDRDGRIRMAPWFLQMNGIP
jgi:NitT/TauT family transport system substrate-binding protein